ncbi:FAD-binding Monooxygenase Superfamily protein [Pleurotus pulmonarius]
MEQHKSIAIIGAGMGGLTFAIKLKQQIPHARFTIFEKASEVGGTWRDNIYPGAASDVGIHFYSLSTDLKPDWNYTHAGQAEIQEYWINLARKYELYPHIVFNTRIVGARWNADEQRYQIEGENVATQAKVSTHAEILISAQGILETPNVPKIPGLSKFKGDLFHSARWREDVLLEGKKVGVIGNGASAMQFIPHIAEQPRIEVTQFCRTAKWIIPPVREPYSPLWKWCFTHMPLLLPLYRLMWFMKYGVLYMIFSNPLVHWLVTKWSTHYMLSTAPKRYHKHIIPKYPLGCKRVLFNNFGYLESLHKPNVQVIYGRPTEIVEDGVLMHGGDKIPLDVIILATGFVTDQYAIDIHGVNGQTVQEYYDKHGAPRAYIGTSLPGFPNFYMLAGPNTATGHTSVLYAEELQANYCLALIAPVLSGKAKSFEVTHEATDAYNKKIQSRLSRSVFVHCNSWYRKGGDGIISSIFPGSQTRQWWWLRAPVWKHYSVITAESRGGEVARGDVWRHGQRHGTTTRVVFGAFALGLALAGVYFS